MVPITTYRFSKDAEEYATKIAQEVVQIDGVWLAESIMDWRHDGEHEARHRLLW